MKPAIVGLVLTLVAGATTTTSDTQSRDESLLQTETPTTSTQFTFDGNKCQFVHPNTIKAFQIATTEPWTADSPPTWSKGSPTQQATLTVVTQKNTREWPLIMVERKLGGAEYVPIKIGSAWVRDDSLLSRLIVTFETTRRLPWQEHWTVNDSHIPGGFTQQELDSIGSDTLRKLAAENRDWKPTPMAQDTASAGSCCAEKPTKDATGKAAASCGKSGGGCRCGSSCGPSAQPTKSNQLAK